MPTTNRTCRTFFASAVALLLFMAGEATANPILVAEFGFEDCPGPGGSAGLARIAAVPERGRLLPRRGLLRTGPRRCGAGRSAVDVVRARVRGPSRLRLGFRTRVRIHLESEPELCGVYGAGRRDPLIPDGRVRGARVRLRVRPVRGRRGTVAGTRQLHLRSAPQLRCAEPQLYGPCCRARRDHPLPLLPGQRWRRRRRRASPSASTTPTVSWSTTWWSPTRPALSAARTSKPKPWVRRAPWTGTGSPKPMTTPTTAVCLSRAWVSCRNRSPTTRRPCGRSSTVRPAITPAPAIPSS